MIEIELARIIAHAAHDGQWYGEGDPYVNHAQRVAERVTAAGGSDVQIAAAWLHDVLEDTDWTANDLRAYGITDPIIRIVEGVSRKTIDGRKELYHASFITRCAADPELRLVKRCDVEENLSRLPGNKTADEAQGLERRYCRALGMLD